MTATDRYFQCAAATLAEVAATQAEALEAAARLVADSVAAGGVLHLFGAGHSQLVALDAFARAGGLACVNPIVDPALGPAAGLDLGRVERTPGGGAPPPVVVSQNLDGRDATQHNQQLLRAYRGRTRLPL